MINAELMKKINIDGKFIGKDCPFYIIAEAGANHDGQLEKAFQLNSRIILHQNLQLKLHRNTGMMVTKRNPNMMYLIN